MKKKVIANLILLLTLFSCWSCFAEENVVYETVESAAAVLKAQLLSGQKNVDIDITSKLYSDNIINEILAAAEAHTGVPDEGDYLRLNTLTLNMNNTELESEGRWRLSYSIEFYTTPFREKILDRALNDVLQRLELDGLSDLEKVRRIYSYVCTTVQYDFEVALASGVQSGDWPEDRRLAHSAYGALLRDDAVCQGYALLLYRMLNQAGVDCRIVVGTSKGERHGWNLVRIDGVYYYLDATWDSGSEEYQYFMRGASEFDDHTPEDPDALETLNIAQTGLDIQPASLDYYDFYMDESDDGSQPYQEPLANEEDSSGFIDDSVSWEYSGSAHRLTIRGEGAVRQYGAFRDLMVREIRVEAGITEISDYAFYSLERCLETVVLPEGLVSIGERAFFDCRKLKQINIPSTVKTIGAFAFGNCYAMGSVSLPAGLETLDVGVFMCCTSLTLPELPMGLTRIERATFFKCWVLDVQLPPKLVFIGENAFYGAGLTNITIPETVETIETGAFNGCRDLKHVQFYNVMDELPADTFHGSSSLLEVVLPEGLKTIGERAFQNCSALNRVYSASNAAQCSPGTIYLPDSVETIAEEAFLYCESIRTIRWSERISEIGINAFGCSGLTSMVWPQGIPFVLRSTFSGCQHLEAVEFPEDVTSLDAGVFFNGRALKKVIFRGNAPEIDDMAFNYTATEIHYPAADETWKALIGKNFGGEIIWVADAGQSPATLLSPTGDIRLGIGESRPISWVSVQDQTVGFTSSAPEVVSVDGDGIMTARAEGTAEIHLTAGDFTESFLVTVPPAPAAIHFSRDVYIMKAGETNLDLEVMYEPEGSYSPIVSVEINDLDHTELSLGSNNSHVFMCYLGEASITFKTLNGVSKEVRFIGIRYVGDHEPLLAEESEATCTEPGYQMIVCSQEHCGRFIKKRISQPALGHLREKTASGAVRCTRCGELLTYDLSDVQGVFFLPAGTKIVEAQAFEGSNAQAVVINADCKEIHSRAFSGCDSLMVVKITGMDTEIDADILLDSGNAVLEVLTQSRAWSRAVECGIPFIVTQ